MTTVNRTCSTEWRARCQPSKIKGSWPLLCMRSETLILCSSLLDEPVVVACCPVCVGEPGSGRRSPGRGCGQPKAFKLVLLFASRRFQRHPIRAGEASRLGCVRLSATEKKSH